MINSRSLLVNNNIFSTRKKQQEQQHQVVGYFSLKYCHFYISLLVAFRIQFLLPNDLRKFAMGINCKCRRVQRPPTVAPTSLINASSFAASCTCKLIIYLRSAAATSCSVIWNRNAAVFGLDRQFTGTLRLTAVAG